MGPLAAQQKPKLWQLNYFTDKAELEALGPKRPVKVVVVEEEGRSEVGKVHTRRNRKGGRLKNRFETFLDVKIKIILLFDFP